MDHRLLDRERCAPPGPRSPCGPPFTNAALALPGTTVVSAYCDAANAGSNGVLRSVGFDLARAFDGDIFAPGETGCVRVFQRTGPIANEH